MERFQNGTVIVKLGKGGVEHDEKTVIDTRVANIVANGTNE